MIYTKEFCWNVTDWVGSLLELVATADSLTTWILEPSRFCLTFSVTLTLRRRRVEKPEKGRNKFYKINIVKIHIPEEHSVSVGEEGQLAVTRPVSSVSPPVRAEPEQSSDIESTS